MTGLKALRALIEQDAMQKIPEWLKEKVQLARELLGIGDEWNIYVLCSDDLARDKDYDGDCRADASTLNATIRFASTLEEKDAEALVLHEMLHLLHSEIDQIAHLFTQDRPESETLLALYEACNERFISRLSRALIRNVKEVLEAK